MPDSHRPTDATKLSCGVGSGGVNGLKRQTVAPLRNPAAGAMECENEHAEDRAAISHGHQRDNVRQSTMPLIAYTERRLSSITLKCHSRRQNCNFAANRCPLSNVVCNLRAMPHVRFYRASLSHECATSSQSHDEIE